MRNRSAEDMRSVVGRLYDSHGASLYRYALMLLADPEAAEDAIQQVFMAILRQPHRLDDENRYLWRAVRNVCYSSLRRRKRNEDKNAGDVPLLEVMSVDVVDPDQRIALERAIHHLPPEQREVVHLHVFEGRTFQEIAASSETSVNTVSARYRYALVKLRQRLAALSVE